MDLVKSLEKLSDFVVGSKAEGRCGLADCTNGKIYILLALIGLFGATVNWQTFVATLIWEVILGIFITLACRTCSKSWQWLILLLGAAAPALFTLTLAIGSAVVISKRNDF